MNFSERVEALLTEKGKTKIEVAAYAGITTQTFYDWKKKGAVPSADTALKIAQYLGTSVEYLLTGTEKDLYKTKYNNLLAKIEDILNEENKTPIQ